MKAFVEQHPLAAYLALTYILSWSVFIPVALMKHGIIELPVSMSVYYFAAFARFLPPFSRLASLAGGMD